MRKRFRSVVALGFLFSLLGILIAGCGSSSAKADVNVTLTAENTRFSPSRIEVPAGKTVKLTLKNLDANEHDFEVSGLTVTTMSGGGHEGMDMGATNPSTLAVHTQGKKSASVTFTADKKGTYDFYCTVSGHKEMGMVGQLVVN